MIDNEEEYRRMYEVERKLWWYKALHGKVLDQIDRHFGGFRPDLKILDAACGTGGLLSALKYKGFRHLSGFDCSQHAVSLQENGDWMSVLAI